MKKHYLLIALLIWVSTDVSAMLFPDEGEQRKIFASKDDKERIQINEENFMKMKRQTEGLELTKEERHILLGYTVDSDNFVNNYLKSGVPGSGSYQTKIKTLSETLDKFPPSDSNIYRGSSNKRSSGNGEPYYDLDGETPKVVEGDFIVTDKFSSFSYSFEEASAFSRTSAEGDIAVIFGIKNSTNSAPIAPYAVDREAETLVRPGQIYKVKKITSYRDFFDDENLRKKMVTVELEEQEMAPADANIFFMTKGRTVTQDEFQIFKSRLGTENEHLIPSSLEHNVNGGLGDCAAP